MSKQLISFALIPLLGIVFLNIWFYLQQPGMIFYPDKTLQATPEDWGLSYSDISLTTQDQLQIHGWYVPAVNAEHVVLFFHGNAGNISHRGETIKIFHEIGLAVFIIDYRGYGKSQGSMSEAGAYLDAIAAWQFLVKEKGYSPQQIILFGRSLGGAIATELACQVEQKALIIESSFSSVRDMADRVMPVINKLIWLRYKFDTQQKIPRINSPLLLMHSQDDEIIPYELAEKIFQAAKSPRYFFELHGGHNDGFMQDVAGYRQAIQWFIDNI